VAVTGRGEIEAMLATWETRLATAARVRRQRELDRFLGRPPAARVSASGELDDPSRLVAAASTVRLSPIDTRKVEILARESAWWRVAGNPAVAALAAPARQRHTAARPRVGGRAYNRGGLSRLLATSPDETVRRAAWYAEEELGTASLPILRELVTARAAAADGGDGAGAALVRMEVDRAWLRDQLGVLERLTREPYLAALRATASAAGVDHPHPWDLPYLAARRHATDSCSGDEGVAQAKQAVIAIGFPAELIDRPRVHLVPDLPMPACCIAVRPPDEVHVLWRGDSDQDAMGQFAHELTHAVGALVGPADHLLSLLPEPIDEAVAEAVVRLTRIHRPDVSGADPSSHDFAALLALRRNMLHTELEL
jgi:hypothetical protein